MKTLLKDTIAGVFSTLGYDLHIARKNGSKDWEVFDKFLLSSYYTKNKIREAYSKSLEHTGMEWSDNFSKQCRHYILHQMAQHAISNKGDFVECGCWKGQSTYLIASILKEKDFTNTFHVFDSFEGGLSKSSEKDRNERRMLSTTEVEAQSMIFSSTLEEVSTKLIEFDFITLYKGWIPSRFHEISGKEFAFVHLDVDLYQPYIDSLEFLYPRLVEGGVICLDDHGFTQFPGAKAALDEYLADKNPSLFLEIPTGGAILIK